MLGLSSDLRQYEIAAESESQRGASKPKLIRPTFDNVYQA